MAHLTRHQIEYIRNHIHKKSKKEIAKDLGIEKRLVSKYVRDMPEECEPEKTGSSRAPQVISFFENINKRFSPAAVAIISIMVVFTIALILRLAYLYQLKHTYFFAPFKGGYDDYIFDNWAQEILKGNWLGDKKIYIYRMPLYVYFLAAVYYVFGHSYWAVYIIQSLLGALACVAVYYIGSRIFNKTVGMIAALLNAFYGAFLYYNGMLVGETLGIFVSCLAFLFLLLFQEKQRIVYLFMAGIAMGIALLARGNMLIVFFCILLWLIWLFKKGPVLKLMAYLGTLSIGLLLAVSPILMRNYICEKDIVPVTALGGLNVYIGNAYGADGKYRLIDGVSTNPESMILNSIEIAEKKTGRLLKPSEVSNYWVNETFRSIREHGFWFVIPLTARKAMLFWNVYEIPDIWDYYFFKQYIPFLQFPLVSFSLIAAFGFAGMYLAWQKRRNTSLLYFFVFGYMASLVAFFITSRYRIQVIPFLSIFAAYGIAGSIVSLRTDRSKAIACAVIVTAGLLFSYIPVKKTSFETSHNSLGILLKRSGKIDDAIKEYNKAIDIAPTYATPYYNLGVLYRDIGKKDTAGAYFKKALELDPNFTAAREKFDELMAQN